MNMEQENNTSSESEVLQKELEICKKECEEYLNGWKRAKADYINYKKEEAVRFSSWAKMSNEALLEDLLLVLDSLTLGISVLPEKSTERTGIILIKTQLEDILRRHGLEKIQISPGDVFNPLFHEALGEIPSSAPPGTIAEELDSGYSLVGKAIRPVKVMLSKETNNEVEKK
jgi:molecular chaperone GrpE